MKFNKLLSTAVMGLAICNIAIAESEHMEKSIQGNPAQLSAAEGKAQSMDGYYVEEGKVMVRKDGKSTPMAADMKLEDGTMIMMDGSVKTTEGNTIMLKDGDMLSMDGKISKPTRYAMEDGKMMIKRDGKKMIMTTPAVIGDGTQVMLDGTIMMKDGKTKMLKDGQEVDWDGRIKSASKINSKPGKL